MSYYQKFGKRAFDLVCASLVLIVASPFLLIAAMLVRITLGSPVFFRQKRPGLHGHIFTILKFRTMSDAKDVSGQLLADAHRLTRVGRLLRAASVDELPELANVIRGDMSLVGPRPLLVKYLPYYTAEQARRHDMRPGITGWAQVNGRNTLSWEQKFEYDLWYVANNGFWLDLKILVLTLRKTIEREGISNGKHATMPEFMGCADRAARRSE